MYSSKTEGIVVRSYDFGEGHRIVVLFTAQYGKIKAVAKGSRKTRSKYGASLEPLSENHFLLYRKPSQVLFTITGCKVIRSWDSIRGDMYLFGWASMMVEAIDYLYASEDKEIVVYNLLKQALKDIGEGQAPATTWLFLFRALKHAGYRLNFFRCGACEKKVNEVIQPYFSPHDGGLICGVCRKKGELLWPVSSNTVQSICNLSPNSELQDSVEREIGNIIKKFIKYQFGKDLKSPDFINIFKDKKNVFSGFNMAT